MHRKICRNRKTLKATHGLYLGVGITIDEKQSALTVAQCSEPNMSGHRRPMFILFDSDKDKIGNLIHPENRRNRKKLKAT